ncbi:Sodium/calcium exchanger protein-domain-containing protein [Gamsiella multidivaricata]|uniref:Sodium/calcium exchanger protein-domain-containing protein n=1 Tax=Gamsiella multidivaricata TaxID=101098 RepID=UPI00222129A7|nr:Sodium/calcium exchanger protein-domain-containing protein [Gamsiella multidivaricata]KAI7818415.1 Sodium/calcium exchanger protein-domain-containing protein [Gamsiella multidivaricata]
MNSSEPTQNRRTSTGSGSDQTTNADYVASKPTSLRNRHEVDTSPSSPLTTHPEKKVTLRSMTSLRSTLPKTDGPIIGQEHSHRQLSLLQCLKAILFASKINVMLIFIPIGIVAAKLHWPDVAVFILNFLAIVPLAKLLGYATEEISLRLGENLGALLNASFGNAVELILSIIALKEGKIAVVQASVLGSVLSNLLLVLGFCFVFGGYKYKTQTFNQTAAQTSASLLSLSCLSLLIPAAFHATTTEIDQTVNIQHLSYGTSIVLLVVYVLYLVFQLKTHTHLYATDSSEEEEPILPLWLGIVVLLIITVIVAFCAEFLVGSIDGLSHSWNISPTFIGLILLPIVGNAAEHVTAVSVAMKDKMDLAIGVAIGSSMQIALFVTPLMVIIGWIIHQPMTLFFNTFETCVLFVSVLIVNYLIQDGESNWLEGVMLLSTYLIVAIAIYFYPASAVESGGQ